MEKVNLGDIFFEGFVFRKYEPDSVILHRLNELRFLNGVAKNQLHPFVKDWYMTLWKKWDLNIENVHFRVKELLPGESLEMQTSKIHALYKAIIFCPTEPLAKNSFKYSVNGKLKTFTPQFGDIVFTKTNTDKYTYGIKKIIGEEPLRIIEIHGNKSLTS